MELKNIPVVILCGGMGTRLAEETETKPKPLVEIGEKPILWHIMKSYARFGFENFILCLGYKGQMLRDYFLNYVYYTQDIRIQLTGCENGAKAEIIDPKKAENWNIILSDTGSQTMTGSRVKRIEKYINSDHFCLTYGDGVSDVNLQELVSYHLAHRKVGTVTGVRPPGRFGELLAKPTKNGHQVTTFIEKPHQSVHSSEHVHGYINGGFFVFSRKFFDYLPSGDNCTLERGPLERLNQDGELMMFAHRGFWQCMDNMRDVLYLRELWASGTPPWKTW